VDTRKGVQVPALVPGRYTATWVITDANGDTRTLTTRLVEQTGARPKAHSVSVSCHLAHKKITCKVTFANKKVSGKLPGRRDSSGDGPDGGRAFAAANGHADHDGFQ